ncbi:MAG: hypothetical protein SGARI_007921 [Bacillariaceae sp.]
MVEILVEHRKLTSNDVKGGLEDFIDYISYEHDAPCAYGYLGGMLASMLRTQAIDLIWKK